MTFRQFLAITALVFVALRANALTLEKAATSARSSSHDIKRLQLEEESSQLNERKAIAGYLPKIDLNARRLFSERFEELEISFGGATVVMPAYQPYTLLALEAHWNVFDGFATTNGYRAAKASTEAASHRLNRAEQQLDSNVRSLFYHALGAQLLVAVAEENLKALETHLADVTSRVKSGVSTRFDSLRVEVQIEEAKTEKLAADDAAAVSRARLFEAIGLADDGKPLEGNMPEDFSKIEVSKAKLESLAREDRAAQISEVEALHDVSKASLAHWAPQVTLFGSQEWYNNINTSIDDAQSRFKPAYSVGVLLKWNLFDGGAAQASARQAQLSEEAAKEKLASLETSIPVGLDEAKRRLEYDVANYKAKLVSIRKAEESVRLARSGFRAGTRTNTEILDAVIDMNRVRASLVKSQIEAIDALGALELAVGTSLVGQL